MHCALLCPAVALAKPCLFNVSTKKLEKNTLFLQRVDFSKRSSSNQFNVFYHTLEKRLAIPKNIILKNQSRHAFSTHCENAENKTHFCVNA
jgi:hypothetical protein